LVKNRKFCLPNLHLAPPLLVTSLKIHQDLYAKNRVLMSITWRIDWWSVQSF